MAGGVCVSREVGVGACEQASAPGSFSGHILAQRKLRNAVPWLTLTTWESGDRFLPSPQ